MSKPKSERVISPHLDDLDEMKPSLSKGLRKVVDFFAANLPVKWEIYVRPYLNGLRPDIVLLHPEVGIAIYEVKDWDLDANKFYIGKDARKRAEICVQRGTSSGPLRSGTNPLDRLRLYQLELQELYCPRLQQRAGIAVINTGVIFPFSKTKYVKGLFTKFCEDDGRGVAALKYTKISGSDKLCAEQIGDILPDATRRGSSIMSSKLAKDLRNWLVEPDAEASKRRPLPLDASQRNLVMTRTDSGYRRIRGPAGSGKSLVLAARAAQLQNEGKNVLVVTYNVTLINYLMALAARWPKKRPSSGGITWLNFHMWCKRACYEAGWAAEYSAMWARMKQVESHEELGRHEAKKALTAVLQDEMPDLVMSALNSRGPGGSVSSYDAVLVDEGQDILPKWWNVLRKVCVDGGECLLVADATQDIYETAKAWTDQAMSGAGFTGGWTRMTISYRMPSELIDCMREFAKSLEGNIDLPNAPQIEFYDTLYPVKLRWVQTPEDMAVDACVKELLQFAPWADPKIIAMTDITFLCPTVEFGKKVVEAMRKKKILFQHTFDKDSRKARVLKQNFFSDVARFKATTIHSYKGWESRCLVVYIGSRPLHKLDASGPKKHTCSLKPRFLRL